MDIQTAKILEALEESLWHPDTRFDDALMSATFADDFIEFGRSGRVYSRNEMLLGHMAGSQIKAVLPLRDFKARYLAQDVAQVTYISAVDYDGVTAYANRSSIWSRIEEGWQLRFHQGTPRAD